MSSLLTEILISLVVIAVIGGIIGWLVRGVHLTHQDAKLDNELSDNLSALEDSKAQIQKLTVSMKQMNQLRNSEKEKLEKEQEKLANRIQELEPLFDIVEKRDARIRELTEELSTIQKERQAELEQLQFDLSTRTLLGDDDGSELARLQDELRLANRQRESAISRYQNQVRQIENLESSVTEKAKLADELTQRVIEFEKSKAVEQESTEKQVLDLKQHLQDQEDQLALLKNKKQYELQLLEARAGKAEQRAEELRERLQNLEELKNEFLTRENDLKFELSELRSELTQKENSIVSLEKELHKPTVSRPTAIRAVPGNPAKPLFVSNDQAGLQVLKGIGPTTEVKLNQLGIDNLMQIAALSDEDITRISKSLPKFASQLKRFNWIETAKQITQSSADQSTQGTS